MLIFVLITVGKRVDGGGQEQAKEGKQKEGDLGEDSSEGTTSRKCTDVGGKEPAARDTGKDGDLVEGSSKETTNEPMNANMQEEESRYAAECASQGRQVGPCGFSGKACKFPLLAARKCLTCEVSYHELCAHAANTEGVIKEYQDGCPTCHMDVL